MIGMCVRLISFRSPCIRRGRYCPLMTSSPISVGERGPGDFPSDVEEGQRTERVLLGTFVAVRSLHIGLGAVHLALEPRGFSSRWRGWASLALSAASTAVVARRVHRRAGSSDPWAAVTDTCAHLVAVRLGDSAVAADRGTGSGNVAFLPSTWSPAVAAAWSGMPVGGAVLAAVTANWVAIGSRARSRESGGGVASNVTVYLGIFTVAGIFARTLRAATAAALQARVNAVREAEVLSVQESRLLLHAALHRRTVASLSEIRGAWSQDRGEARRRARVEAARLRRFINGDGTVDIDSLGERLGDVVEGAAARGLNVDLHLEETIPCHPDIQDALCAAVAAALANISDHAGSVSAVVRVVSGESGARAVIRDHGVGFELPTENWVPPSLHQAAAGLLTIECRSAPGEGTRIVISGGAR